MSFSFAGADPPLNPYGGTIIGDTVVWSNDMAELVVWPHTVGGMRITQYANLTWKYPTMSITAAFAFPFELATKDIWIWRNMGHNVEVDDYGDIEKYYIIDQITGFTPYQGTPPSVDYGDIPSDNYYTGTTVNGSYVIGFDSFEWLNPEHTAARFCYHVYGLTGRHNEIQYWPDWDNINHMFSYQEYNGKHFYYVDFNAVQDNTYKLKWTYHTRPNVNGKWELYAKRSSDTIQQAISSGYYCALDPWYNSEWLYKKKITIDSGDITSTLTNFPVCIYANADSDLNDNARSDGADIMFTNDAEDTVLAHEIEYYDSGTLWAWVNVTSVAHDSNTDIYMYYGNSSGSDLENPAGVWDSNYLVVNHLNVTGFANDSTSNGNDAATVDGTDLVAGKIYNSHAFEDSNTDYIELTTNIDGLAAITVECWTKPDTLSGSTHTVMSSMVDTNNWNEMAWYIHALTSLDFFWRVTSDGGEITACTTEKIAGGVWYHMAAWWDGTNAGIFLNSSISGSDSGSGTMSTVASGKTCYGVERDGAGYRLYYDGTIDEVRISNIARSQDWIEATYNNIINISSGFLTWGSEESEAPANDVPYISNPVPANESEYQDRPATMSIDVEDLEGATMMVQFNSNSSGSWKEFGNNASGNGTVVIVNNNFTASNTIFYWNVTVYDGTGENTSEVFHYQTTLGVENPPSDFSAGQFNETQINLSWDRGTNSTYTHIRRKIGSAPTTLTDGTLAYNDSEITYYDTGLDGGTHYYYSAWAYNVTLNEFSASYVSDDNHTYPSNCTDFAATSVDNDTISLSWSNGTGSDKTHIQYNTGAYPVSVSAGTNAYNDTGTSVNVDSLSEGTVYYFRAWSWNDTSNLFSLLNSSDYTATASQPSNITNLTVTTYTDTQLNMTWTQGNGTASVVVRKTVSYPANADDGTVVFNASGTSYTDTGLDPSTQYYYSAWSFSGGLFSAGSNQANNWTRPQNPQNATGNQEGTAVNLSWDNATGADNYLVIRKSGSYPSNLTDGTEIYNDTAIFYNDTAYTAGDYYTGFSYNNSSMLYSDGVNILWGGLTVNVFNESNVTEALLDWSIFVTNASGSETVEYHNQDNGNSFDINLLPWGANTVIKINDTGFKDRIYIMNIYPNEAYTLNAYLPPDDDITSHYIITVENQVQQPVDGAHVDIKKYISAGLGYVDVVSKLTDGAGQIDVNLIPETVYLVEIVHVDYLTLTTFWTPPEIIYAADTEKTFMLTAQTQNYTNETSYHENIAFNVEGNTTHIFVNYTDSMLETVNTSFIVIEIDITTDNTTNMAWYNDTGNNTISFNYASRNTSNSYKIIMYLNHLTFQDVVDVRFLDPVRTVPSSEAEFNDIFGIFGSNPFGWSGLLGIFVLLACLFGFGEQNVGLSILLAGFIMAGFNVAFGIAIFSITICIFIIIMGMLVQWRMERRRVGFT